MVLRAPGYGEGGSNGPRVTPDTLPAVRRDANAPLEFFGGGAAVKAEGQAGAELGQTGAAFGNKIQQIGQQAEFQADRTVVMDKNLQAMKARDSAMGQMTNLHGPDAVKMQPEVEAGLKKNIDEISSDLTERQRKMFQPLAVTHINDFSRAAQNHSDTEMKSYQKQVALETIKSYQTESARNPFDPRGIQANKEIMLSALNTHLSENGISGEGESKPIADEARLGATTGLHVGVIDSRLSAGKTAAAANYFELHKDEIDPKYYLQIKNSLKEGDYRDQSQRTVDGLMKKYSTFAAARPSIQAIEDPGLRDAVESRAQREYALNEKQAGDTNDAEMVKWSDAVQKAGTTDAIPPQVLSAMTGPQQQALKDLANHAVGMPPKEDPTVYAKYSAMLPGQLAKVSQAEMLTKVKPYVSPAEFDQISNAWTKNRDTANPESQAEAKSIFNDKQLVFNALQTAKVIPSTQSLGTLHKDQAASDAYRDFATKVDAQFQAYTHTNGKAPDATAKQQIIDGMLIKKVLVPSGWFGMGSKEKPVNVLSGDEAGKSYVKIGDIPVQHQNNLQAVAAKLGNPSPTKDQLQRAYAAALEHDNARVSQILSGK